MLAEELGSKIKEARLSAKLTQKQLADALGVSAQSVSNWESSRNKPDFKVIQRIADTTNKKLNWFIQEESLINQTETEELILSYSLLNDKGKELLLNYTRDLMSLDKYH